MSPPECPPEGDECKYCAGELDLEGQSGECPHCGATWEFVHDDYSGKYIEWKEKDNATA